MYSDRTLNEDSHTELLDLSGQALLTCLRVEELCDAPLTESSYRKPDMLVVSQDAFYVTRSNQKNVELLAAVEPELNDRQPY